MRHHPDLHSKTSESIEIISYATVLLLRAMAQATVVGKKTNSTVHLGDVNQVCLNSKELHFMSPLSATLDASAFDLVPASKHADAEPKAAVAGPGQSTLNAAAFGASDAAEAQEAQGTKRKLECDTSNAADVKASRTEGVDIETL